jgi:flagellar motor switch protein FliM
VAAAKARRLDLMTSNVHAFDRKLLARMTGALGDDRVIGRLALELGQVFGEFLPDICRAETGLDITIGYAGHRTGMRRELIASMGFGPVLSTFSIIVPQSVLLKTTIVFPKGSGQQRKAKAEWTEQLEEQVRRSAVTIEARIRLESLTLDTISRLQPGDVIPFLDAQDVRVDVNANGRDLYVCEFGRAGSKYTVRVKDTHGSEQDILRHIMS